MFETHEVETGTHRAQVARECVCTGRERLLGTPPDLAALDVEQPEPGPRGLPEFEPQFGPEPRRVGPEREGGQRGLAWRGAHRRDCRADREPSVAPVSGEVAREIARGDAHERRRGRGWPAHLPVVVAIVRDARRSLASRLLRLQVGAIDGQKSGDLISRVTSDTTYLRAIAVGALDAGVTATLTLVVAAVLMAFVDFPLFLTTLVVLGATLALIGIILPRIMGASKRSQDAVGEIGTLRERPSESV